MRIVTIKDIDAPTCFFFKLRKARNHKQMQQLSCGRSPGVGRLPFEFYKKFWALIGLVCCTETMSEPEDSTSLLYKTSPHIAYSERRSWFAEEVETCVTPLY